MLLRPTLRPLLQTGLVTALLLMAAPALAQQNLLAQNCSGTGTTVVSLPEQNAEKDRDSLAPMAPRLSGKAVCLIAWIDPQDGGLSTRLASRRVRTVTDALIAQGIQPLRISNQLRPVGMAERSKVRSMDVMTFR